MPEIRESSGYFADTSAGVLAGIPIAGVAGDQQAALFGQLCLGRRDGEEHLWHGLLHAAQHRCVTRGIAPRPAHHRGLEKGRRHHPCPGGQRLHRRRRGAVAARQSRPHQVIRRCGGPGRLRSGQRRRVPRARIRRAGRAPLGLRRARHDGRDDQGHDRRAHRARGAGGDSPPSCRCAGCHARGCGATHRRTPRGRGGIVKRPADAVSGGHTRDSHCASPKPRNHGPGCGLSRGTGHRLLEGERATGGDGAGGTKVRSTDAGVGCLRHREAWGRALQRSLDWDRG